MRNASAPPTGILWPLLVMVMGAGAHAAETLMITDIPAEAVATDSKLLEPPQQVGDVTDTAPDPETLKKTVDQYEHSISELQQAHGVFYDRIGEELTGLGIAYRNLGQYPEALAAFNRALHISRVNNGLQNLQQLPILEQIIAINTATGDWAALDQNYQYLYWINRRSLGATDLRLLPVIDRLAGWHLNAYTLAVDPLSFNHLLSANTLFLDAAAIIETNYGPYDQRLINPLYGIAMANYQMAFHAYNSGDYVDFRSSTTNPNRLELMLEEEGAIQELISHTYRTGKMAMLRVIDINAHNPDMPATARGTALIYLGDWYLLFNRRSTANETYALAYARLTESGMHKAEIDKLFEHPRSLPALQMPVVNQLDDAKEDNDNNYVLAKFDVSKTGKATNIEIIEAKPADDELIQRRAKDAIRATRFRPRLEDGQPVETTDVNIRYVFHE